MKKKEYAVCREKVNGTAINFVKTGDGPPLVFIHGWTNNWEGWIPIVKYLKDVFTLYLIDMPGYGNSGDLDNYGVENCARELSHFLKILPIKPAAVIGLSMGCFVVAEMVRKNPDITESIVLIGPVLRDGRRNWLFDTTTTALKLVNINRISVKLLRKLILTKTMNHFTAKYINMYKYNSELVDHYGMEGKKKMRMEAFMGLGISSRTYNLADSFFLSHLPTLLIYGREDKIASFGQAEKYCKDHGKISLTVIPQAGHMVHWEKPEETANSIITYLKKLHNSKPSPAKILRSESSQI